MLVCVRVGLFAFANVCRTLARVLESQTKARYTCEVSRSTRVGMSGDRDRSRSPQGRASSVLPPPMPRTPAPPPQSPWAHLRAGLSNTILTMDILLANLRQRTRDGESTGTEEWMMHNLTHVRDDLQSHLALLDSLRVSSR